MMWYGHTSGKEEVMTSCRSLRMLFSAALFLILFVPLATAAQAESSAAKGRTEVASCQRCGDGYCAPSCENERTCPADCRSTKRVAPAPAAPAPAAPAAASTARCGRCGDGQCVKSCGETAQSCPVDCGGGGEPSVASTPATESAKCPAIAVAEKPKAKAGK
jgi:hypothetical protein